MIPIVQQPEPLDFQIRVADKGRKFLKKTPHPKIWKNKSYWTEILPDLWDLYGAVCAYCCHWIPLEQGSASVDHFIPKSIAPDKAYDWSNYRLVASKMNAKKGDATDVIDPFGITKDTFILVFPAMLVKPNPELPALLQKAVWDTIKRLDLNDDDILVKARLRWVLDYCDGHISFPHLEDKAPFIASEIKRQDLFEKLPYMFGKRRVD